jgi:Mce-associated membrane protein
VRALAALPAVLAALTAGGCGSGSHEPEPVRAAATPASAAIFSYDYRTFDASVESGRSFTTGTFTDEYVKTTDSLKATAISEQAVVTAQTSVSGVIDATPQRVEVLLYVNQYRRNSNISGEKVDQNRVVLTLVSVDGSWKVAGAAAV